MWLVKYVLKYYFKASSELFSLLNQNPNEPRSIQIFNQDSQYESVSTFSIQEIMHGQYTVLIQNNE